MMKLALLQSLVVSCAALLTRDASRASFRTNTSAGEEEESCACTSHVQGDGFAADHASSTFDLGSGMSTPTFYMMDDDLGQAYTQGFKYHPARIDSLEEADFAVTCCFNLGSMQKFVDLPRRPVTKPYLVMAHQLQMDECNHQPGESDECALARKLIEHRKDFTFVNFDLRDHVLTHDHAKPLPGVTLAPPKFYEGPPINPLQDPRYFLTFRGKVREGLFRSSTVRTQIQEAFKNFQVKGTVVEFLPQEYNYRPEDLDLYNDLLNTSYALVPHGDGRWNYRFSEVVGACAIPVVIADGLTLPFEGLIDWKAAGAVILQEETEMPTFYQRLIDAAKKAGTMKTIGCCYTPEYLLQLLPTSPDQIQQHRRRICEINDKYFSSEAKRATAILKAAAIRAGARPRRTVHRRLA